MEKIHFDLDKSFQKKDERKEHLKEKIAKKIKRHEDAGTEYSFISLAKRAIQEVLPPAKFEAYAAIAKAIAERYSIELSLGKSGNTDLSTNRHGQHSWYIKFKEESEEVKRQKEELVSQLEIINNEYRDLIKQEKLYVSSQKEIFSPIVELHKKHQDAWQEAKHGWTHLFFPTLPYQLNEGTLDEMISEIEDTLRKSRIETPLGIPYERWTPFYAQLENLLQELEVARNELPNLPNYIQHEQRYGRGNTFYQKIQEQKRYLTERENNLKIDLETAEQSDPNIIAIKDHFAVGQGTYIDLGNDDYEVSYSARYQYKTIKDEYIDKTVLLEFNKNHVFEKASVYLINKAYNDGFYEINWEESPDYLQVFNTLNDCVEYLKNN